MLGPEKCIPVDSLRAEELKRMSASEREAVWNDVHCCPETTFEDAKDIGLRMEELELAIQDELLTRDADFGDVYRRAVSIDNHYVQNPELRLAFLRAERFSVRDSARRFVGFLCEKEMLWGASRLNRRITIDDFDHEDMKGLRSGQLQLLPHKDQSGRQIICHVISDEDGFNENSVLRTIFYLTMAALDEEENQHLGLVGLTYHTSKVVNGTESASKVTVNDCTFDFHARLARLRNVLPLRYASMHYCIKTNHPSAATRINREIQFLDSHTRARCMVHCEASTMELHFMLSSFGISAQNLPVSILGTLKTGYHNAWLQGREIKEKCFPLDQGNCLSMFSGSTFSQLSGPLSSSQCIGIGTSRAVAPSCNDVLFGRGKVKGHPGNIQLHKLIDERRLRYERAPKWGKTVIANEIVSIIMEKCGRFLKLENPNNKKSRTWVVVGMDGAREKVAHTFRSKRSR